MTCKFCIYTRPINTKFTYVTEIYRSFSLKMKTFGWLIEVIERHVPYFCLSIDFKTNGDGATVDDRSLQWHKAAAVAQVSSTCLDLTGQFYKLSGNIGYDVYLYRVYVYLYYTRWYRYFPFTQVSISIPF